MFTNKKILIILILISLILALYIKQIKHKKEHLEINDAIIFDLTKIYFSNKKINSENYYINSENYYINSESNNSDYILSENLNFSFEDLNVNNKLCLSSDKCITGDMINTLNNSDNIVNNYMYLPNSPNKVDNNIIWNDIFSQIKPDNNAMGKLRPINGTWNLTYNSTKWNNKYIYQLNNHNLQPDGTGIEITIPPPTADMTGDFTVLWILILSDILVKTTYNSYTRWSNFKVYDYTNPSKIRNFGNHIVGCNKLDNISPDGSTSNVQYDKFSWWPVPIDLSGNSFRKLMISSFKTPVIYSNDEDVPTWFAGFAFSTNPWNHCPITARSLYLHINSLDTAKNPMLWVIRSDTADYKTGPDYVYGRHAVIFYSDTSTEFRIPFVNSQKDKIFYLIENNNNWGASISYLEIKNKSGKWIKIGNLYTSFDNPFSRHNNSKMGEKYYGVVIPKEYLPVKGTLNDNFITLKLTVPTNGWYYKPVTYQPTTSQNGLFTREVGTHDVSPFN